MTQNSDLLPTDEHVQSVAEAALPWVLISDLAEVAVPPWRTFCGKVAHQLVERGFATLAAVWEYDQPTAVVSLVAQRNLARSPLLTHAPLKTAHEEWLGQALVLGDPLSWLIPEALIGDQPMTWATVFAGRTNPVQGRCAVLELIPADTAPLNDMQEWTEFLSELSRLMENVLQQSQAAHQADSTADVALLSRPAPSLPDLASVHTPMTVSAQQTTSLTMPSSQTAGRTNESAPPRMPEPARAAAVGPTSSPPVVSSAGEKPQVPVPTVALPSPTVALPSPVVEPSKTADSVMWPQLVTLALNLQKTLSVKEVASVAANDGRVWLGCDRVTVLVGRRPRVVGVSHAGRVSRRSPWVRTLEHLARVSAKAKLPIQFPEADATYAPEVEEPLTAYLAEGHARLVHVQPLVVTPPRPLNDDAPRRPAQVIGCLVAEQLTEGDIPPNLSWRVEQLADVLGRPLANAQAYESVFLLPLWRAIGETVAWFRGRRIAWTAAILALIAGVVAAMVFVPWDYRIEADGLLLPSEKRDVFVPLDAEVREVLIASGQQVKQGELLVRLANPELEQQTVAARTQRTEKMKLQRALQFQIDEAQRRGDRENELKLFGQLEETRAQIIGLTAQLKILEGRLAKLDVTAPVSGTVATFQVDQLLKHRPVQRGEVLLTIMNQTSPWQLELEVDEARLGHLVQAQQASGDSQRSVEYVLVTRPEQHHQAVLRDVATRATMGQEQQLVVRLIADLKDADLGDQQRVGAEVRARIDCGRKPLGYVLFGDVIEFLQRYVWW